MGDSIAGGGDPLFSAACLSILRLRLILWKRMALQLYIISEKG
jgi:hypothetical protein